MISKRFSGDSFHKGFACVSPVFAVCAMALAAACFAPAVPAQPSPSSSNKSAIAYPTATGKPQAAHRPFARAGEQRAALNSKPAEKRSLADYKHVVDSYRRVYLITPHAGEVPDALKAVAEIYTEMGDQFGRSYFQSAVDTYQFLMREYPTSKYCQDAYLRAAKLQKDQLGDNSGAIQTYETFLKKYPRSPHKREAQEARAELAVLQNSAGESAKSTIAKSADGDNDLTESGAKVLSRDSIVPSANQKPNGRIPQIRKITTKSAQDSTRVTIDLESGVQFVSGRIANPDRIYFDLHAAKLTPQLAHSQIKTDGGLVSAVRVAQNPSGVARVVLDVHGVKDYSASLLNNPSRLVIDLYASAQAMQTAKSNEHPQDGAGKESATAVEMAPDRSKGPSFDSGKSANVESADASEAMPQPKSKLSTAKIGKSTSKKPDLVTPASTALPTRDGQATLTRALGLKIGRIVIDAGHGGHDTGTIAPTGLMEKDLCLEIALRLGKLIAQRLPSAEVVYTRSDDTFIPLEERTHIANEAKADMFISIHANSSRDSDARGIETYYLNLKGSAEAMEVAARENATDDQGIHELQDMVKQIARTEKIDESQEFAADVQDSLAKRVQKAAKPGKNRGVRKAPFVVRIGAELPASLTGRSFRSNQADEKMLKQTDAGARVPKCIYQGVASYCPNLNS